MKDTPIKATSLSTSGGRGEHAEPAVLTSEAKGSPRRRARRQRVGGVRLAPIIPFYSILSNFYTFSEQFLYLFGVVFTQKGIGYSDQNRFPQRLTFVRKGYHNCIVEISGKHCGLGASRA